MKRILLNGLMALGVLALVAVPVFATDAAALAPGFADAVDQAKNGVTKINDGNSKSLTAFIKDIVNILLFILGTIAVLVIIIGGIRYATSGGDSNQITGAKNTILYAIIGLVVALMAFAIVNFVLNSLG